ncbi:DNA-binding domain-containing protein [Curvibacter sp. APW13]|uniref:HvfC/BufC N-terminal domain-containing protein n=1 Tax=Curvibacter sp. APW13 TaxID=3077236 RepID=UPI0028DF9D49|nr:DNA-binding domain-containing protein [Curvibacter sp. APW13]MDT8989669.1 DNA-binding domain-containing protein [Curvibacter sp. APW13]
MSTLAAQQAEFQRALLHDQPLPAGRLTARSAAQFAVYREAYRARLRAALRDNYEVLPRVMGDDAFDALANAYLAAHPSQHFSLRWFGHQLPTFMLQHQALVDHPAFTDLARIEWALRQAFDAPDTPALQVAELQALPPARWTTLQLALHPSVQLLTLQWAVGPVWHAVQSGADELPPPPALEHPLLVWRKGLRTQWKSLSATEAELVRGIAAAHTFGTLCQDLAAHVGTEHAAATAASHLRTLVQAEALAALPPST